VRFLQSNVVGDKFGDAGGRICFDNIVINRHLYERICSKRFKLVS
jgi:hypothetical protein